MTNVLPAGQLALLRSPLHSAPNGVLLNWGLREIAHATIDQASFAFPLPQITVTGATSGWTSADVGQLIQIHDGSGNLVATNCVRKTPLSNTLYIGAMGRGDPGRGQLIARDLGNGYTATIYDFRPLFSFYSRISNGVFYKRYDVAYSDEGSNPTPVCNIGQWQHGFDETGVGVSKTYSAAAADHPSFAWAGKTITGYQWVIVGTGYTVTSGSLASATFTATFAAGFHLVYCTITDSGGKTKKGVRPLWVTPRLGVGAPFNALEATKQNNDRQDLQGRSVSYDLHGNHDLAQSVVYDGGALMHVEYGMHGGQVLDPGVITDHYVGFINAPNGSGNLGHTIAQLETHGVLPRLNKVGNAPQAVIAAQSPANWTEVSYGLNEPSFVAWYVLEHHCPNATALFDFNPLPDSPPVRKNSFALNSRNIGAQLGESMAFVQGNAGTASDGSFFFFRNPNLENTAFRNAMETRMALQTGDMTGDVILPISYTQPASAVTLGGFIVGLGDNTIDAYEVIAPSISEAQGVVKSGGQTIIARSLAELQTRVGDYYAVETSPTPSFQQGISRNFDVFDPARHYNTWFALDIDERFDPRGIGYTGRALITAVDRSWSDAAGGTGAALKKITVTVVPETQGKDGEVLPNVKLQNQPQQVVIENAIPYSNVAWACDDQGGFGMTLTLFDAQPQWFSIKGAITGTVTDFDFNYHSPLITSGLRQGTLGMWAVSVSGTTVKVWYTSNVLSETPLWTNQATYTMLDSTTITQVRLVSNPRTAGNAWVGWRTRLRTYVAHTNNGSTWSGSPTALGTSASDTLHDDAALGMAIVANDVIVSAKSSASFYALYRAVATVGTFTVVPALQVSASPNPVIQRSEANNLYTAVNTDPINLAYTYSYIAFTGNEAFTQLEFSGTPVHQNILLTGSCGVALAGAFGISVDTPVGTHDVAATMLLSMGGATDWEVTAITVEFALESVNGGLALSFSFDYSVDLLDADLNVLYTGTGTQGHVRITAATVQCTPSTFSDSGLSVADVAYVRITCEGSFDKAAANREVWGVISDVVVEVNHDVEYRQFYRVDDFDEYDGSLPPPDWVVITPDDDFIPRHPYAVSSDGSSARMFALLDDSTEVRLYSSRNSGGIMTQQAASLPDYFGVRCSGLRLLLWGDGLLGYSNNGGGTITDRIGNWASGIGTVGTFLKVGAIA